MFSLATRSWARAEEKENLETVIKPLLMYQACAGLMGPTGGTGEVGGKVIISRAHSDNWQVHAGRVSLKPNKE